MCHLAGPARLLDEDDDIFLTEAPLVERAGPVYTLGVQCEADRAGIAELQIIPSIKRRTTRGLLVSAEHADLRALAEHLGPRVAEIFGGEARLGAHPVLAPLCALAATVSTVTGARSRARRGPTTFRPQMFDACLTALDLGSHRKTAERVLLCDHPDHLAVDVHALPSTMALPSWGGSVGLYERNSQGELVSFDHGSMRPTAFAPYPFTALRGELSGS